MDEPQIERTTITVKSVEVEAWAAAKASILRSGETMGAWVSRAIRQLAQREEGVREILPDERPAVSLGLPPVSVGFAPEVFPAEALTLLRETMLAAHAVSVASGVPVPKGVASHGFAVLASQLRIARGMPPIAPRRRALPAMPRPEEAG